MYIRWCMRMDEGEGIPSGPGQRHIEKICSHNRCGCVTKLFCDPSICLLHEHVYRGPQQREKILRVHFMYQGLFGDMVEAIFLQRNSDGPPI